MSDVVNDHSTTNGRRGDKQHQQQQQQHLRCGLYALFMLLDTSSSGGCGGAAQQNSIASEKTTANDNNNNNMNCNNDEVVIGRKAWTLFIRLIFNDCNPPPTRTATRPRYGKKLLLFRTIQDVVEQYQISKRIAKNILQMILVGILHHYVNHEVGDSSNKTNAPNNSNSSNNDGERGLGRSNTPTLWRRNTITTTEQIEHLIGLLDLMLFLFHYCTNKESDVETRNLVCRWHSTLMVALDSSGLKQPKSIHIPSFNNNNDDQLLPYNVTMYLLSLILEDIMHKDLFCHHESNNIDMGEIVDRLLLNVKVDRLLLNVKGSTNNDNMKKIYRSQQKRRCYNNNNSIMMAGITTTTQRRRGDEHHHQGVIYLRSILCDVALEFMTGLRWGWQQKNQDNKQSARRRIRRLITIASTKKMLSNSLSLPQKRKGVLRYHPDTVLSTASASISIFMPCIHNAIRNDDCLFKTDAMISACLDMCSNVETVVAAAAATCDDADNGDDNNVEIVVASSVLERSLHSLWDVYQHLCTESSSVRMVTYLEKQANLLLRDNDVVRQDTTVGFVFSIKSSASIDASVRRIKHTVLTAISTSLKTLIVKLRPTELNCSNNVTNHRSFNNLPTFLLEIIEHLSRDLREGLGGASGGMTNDSFLKYVESMELSCSVLHDAVVVGSIRNDVASAIATVSESATGYLFDIFCSFYIKKCTTFKRALMLALHTLPSLSRAVNHATLLLVDHSESSSCRVYNDSNYAACCFGQCVAILDRKVKNAPGTPWDIIAADHLSDDKVQMEPSDANKSLKEDSADHYSVGSGRNSESAEKNAKPIDVKNLILNQEKVWVWALCSALQALERDWDESRSTLQTEHDYDGTVVSSLTMRSYLGARKRQLRKVLENVSAVLQGPPRQRQKMKDKPSFVVPITVGLPDQAKSQLCAVLDRIVTVMELAVKVVTMLIQRKCSDKDTQSWSISHCEALSCLLAWLDPNIEVSNDFMVGTQRWHASEKELYSPTVRTTLPDDTIVQLLANLLARMEDLQSWIQKLHWAMPRAKATISFEDITNDPCISDGHKKGSSSLHRLLSGKIKRLKDEQNRLQSELGKSTTEGGKMGSKGKKRPASSAAFERRARKERRKRIVRSRNSVIDNWLQIDREVGHNDDCNDTADAYVDLEDFLVEG